MPVENLRSAQERFPAEWEPQSAVLIAWPHADTDWAARLGDVEETYIALVAALVPRTRVVICVADVSGKGISAALVMSNFQSTLRASVLHTDDPLDVLVKDLNRQVMERARGERFITLFIGRVDLGTLLITYVNEGHNAPMVL